MGICDCDRRIHVITGWLADSRRGAHLQSVDRGYVGRKYDGFRVSEVNMENFCYGVMMGAGITTGIILIDLIVSSVRKIIGRYVHIG